MTKKGNEGFVQVIFVIAGLTIAIVLSLFLIISFQSAGYQCIKNGDCIILPLVNRGVFPAATTEIPVPKISQPVISSIPAVNVVDCRYYNINSIRFEWEIPAGVDGVEYGMSENPDYEFSKTSQGVVSRAEYDLKLFDDGILYFSARFKEGENWGPVGVKYFRLDRTPPESLRITRENNDFANEQPVFSWNANDKTSGIAYYRIKIGGGDWFDANIIRNGESYVLPEQSPAYSRTLTVRAYDFAGNFRESFVNFQVIPKTGWRAWLYKWPIFAIAIIIIAVASILSLLIYRLIKWRKKFSKKMSRDLKKMEKLVEEVKNNVPFEDEEEMKKAKKFTDNI